MTDTANAPEHQARANTDPTSEVDELRAELHLLKTAGIIEVAARNPSVMEYMEHWEGCAIKAETHCDELVAAAYLDAAQVLEDEIDLARIALPQAVPVLSADIRAIKNRTPTKAVAALTAYGERMKAEGAREAQAKIARLTEALKWYGEQARLCRLIHSEGDAGRNALNNDGGKRAAAALQENANE